MLCLCIISSNITLIKQALPTHRQYHLFSVNFIIDFDAFIIVIPKLGFWKSMAFMYFIRVL